jgi:hypothetical protein
LLHNPKLVRDDICHHQRMMISTGAFWPMDR